MGGGNRNRSPRKSRFDSVNGARKAKSQNELGTRY